MLAKYSFNANWSVAGRFEYEHSDGGNPLETLSVLYGPGSNAWSFTITPTYSRGSSSPGWKARTPGSAAGRRASMLGSAFNATHQFRGMLEAGFIF